MFIPRLVDLIINVLLAYEGAVKVAGVVVKFSKELTQQVKAINKILTKYLDRVQLKEFSKGFIEKVKESPFDIKIKMLEIQKVKLKTPETLSNKLTKAEYNLIVDDLVIFESKNPQEVEALFNRLSKSDIELKKYIKEARSKFRKTNKKFKEFAEYYKKQRKQIRKNGKINVPLIDQKWNSLIKTTEMKKAVVKDLAEFRKISGLENKNIARGKIKVKLKHTDEILLDRNYIEHAGRGQKIKGSKGLSEEEIFSKELAMDTTMEEITIRSRDSEIKILQLIDEDIARLLEKNGFDIKDIDITITIETTYEPCYVCKTDIILHQEKLGAQIKVVRPMLNGKPVKDSKDFERILKQ